MFDLLLAAQLAAGSYTYTAARDGATVGTSQVTVKANASGVEIDESLSGTLNGQQSSGSATYILAADLSPVSYTANGSIGGDAVKDSATVRGTSASVASAGGEPQSIALAAPATKFVVIDLGAVAGFVPLAAQMNAWSNPDVMVLVPMYGLSLNLDPPTTAQTRPANVPSADVALSFSGHAPFTVWYDPATLVPDEIDVPSQDITVTRKRQ
jgi:hypothetical protein